MKTETIEKQLAEMGWEMHYTLDDEGEPLHKAFCDGFSSGPWRMSEEVLADVLAMRKTEKKGLK